MGGLSPGRRAAALLAALHVVACTPDPVRRAAAPPRAPPAPPSVPAMPAPPATAAVCPTDMVEIRGEYCARVVEVCLKRRKPWQCAEFQAPSVCEGPTQPKHYCIDRYEFPNKKGGLPTVRSGGGIASAGSVSCDADGEHERARGRVRAPDPSEGRKNIRNKGIYSRWQ
jgi:hypothetical protein